MADLLAMLAFLSAMLRSGLTDMATYPPNGNTNDPFEDAIFPIVELYDWGEEEKENLHPEVNPVKTHWVFAEKPWAFGVRGRYDIGQWNQQSECMGILVKPDAVITLCACVISWYWSHMKNNGTFALYSNRDPDIDIAAPNIFVHHLSFEGYQDQSSHHSYFEVMTPPVRSLSCDRVFPRPQRLGHLQYKSFVILCIGGSIFYNGSLVEAPWPPYGHDNIYWDKIAPDLLAYGTQTTNPDVTFSNHKTQTIELKDQLISGLVTKVHYSECHSKITTEFSSGCECFALNFTGICNINPGSIIQSLEGLIAMTVERYKCNIRHRRNIVGVLLSIGRSTFEDQVDFYVKEKKLKNLPLVGSSHLLYRESAVADYEGDFQPSLLRKVLFDFARSAAGLPLPCGPSMVLSVLNMLFVRNGF